MIFEYLNISVTIKVSHLIFSMTILDIIREGKVFQIFYLKSSSYFMQC